MKTDERSRSRTATTSDQTLGLGSGAKKSADGHDPASEPIAPVVPERVAPSPGERGPVRGTVAHDGRFKLIHRGRSEGRRSCRWLQTLSRSTRSRPTTKESSATAVSRQAQVHL